MAPEEALAVALAANPEPVRASERFGEDPEIGSLVRIRADDYGREVVEGELLMIDREEVVLRREEQLTGAVHVHFPRLGYDLRQV